MPADSELRQKLLSSLKGEEAQCEYQLGRLVVGGRSTAVIGIANVGGKVLVGVPESAWDRKSNKRPLKGLALGKVQAVGVQAVPEGDRTQLLRFGDQLDPSEVQEVRLWLGLLKRKLQ